MTGPTCSGMVHVLVLRSAYQAWLQCHATTCRHSGTQQSTSSRLVSNLFRLAYAVTFGGGKVKSGEQFSPCSMQRSSVSNKQARCIHSSPASFALIAASAATKVFL